MAELTEGARLHDRATCGESLTEAERVFLEQWYEEQDAAEADMLAAHRPAPTSDAIPTDLQSVLTQIREIAASIEVLHLENATIRKKIAAL